MVQHIRRMSERSASLLLLLFLGTDFVIIIAHIIDKILAPTSSLCAVAGFCAYLTGYNLIKLFWACLLFAYILKSTRCSGYVAWILVFTYLLVDEASLLHQKIGDYVASSFAAHLPHAPSLQPRYLELAVLVMVGTLLMAIVAWAYFRSPRSFREMSKDMLLFIVVWTFFGVFTDMAAAVMRGPLIEFVSDKVEDFGEMVVLSLIVWYVFLLTIRNGAPDLFLHDVLFQPLTRRSRNQKGSNLAN